MNAERGREDINFARKLLEHSFWEDERVWNLAIAPLSDEQFARETRFGLGSIQRACLHIIETESLCLRRIGGGALDASPLGNDQRERAAIHKAWRAIHLAWKPVIGALDADAFFADCAFQADDRIVELKTWQLIVDLVYQGTAHRADIMRMAAEVHEAPAFDLSLMQYLSGVFRR